MRPPRVLVGRAAWDVDGNDPQIQAKDNAIRIARKKSVEYPDKLYLALIGKAIFRSHATAFRLIGLALRRERSPSRSGTAAAGLRSF
jgi:hypothetical protein